MSSEEARLARERRMAKIKAGGASRLSKITGRDEQPAVTAKVSPAASTSHHDDDPPTVSPASSTPGVNEQDPMSPFLQLLSGQHPSSNGFGQGGFGPNGFGQSGDQGNPMDFMAMLNQQFGGDQLNGSGHPSSAPPPKNPQTPVSEWQRARLDLVWEIVHFIASIAVGLYVAWFNPYGLVLVFVTTQCIIQAARIIIGHRHQAKAMSMLAPFLSMLPTKYQRLVNESAAMFHALRSAYRDMSVVLVVYGLASLGANQHARPVL